VRDERVTITHPCHPLRKRELAVLHYRLSSEPPSVLVEMPDGSAHSVPLSWTDRAVPDEETALCESTSQRISGRAVLELLDQLQAWKGGEG